MTGGNLYVPYSTLLSVTYYIGTRDGGKDSRSSNSVIGGSVFYCKLIYMHNISSKKKNVWLFVTMNNDDIK